MEQFIDIHSHIIPMLDDGATSVENALKMLQIAEDNNIGTIIATPHYIPGEKNATLGDRRAAIDRLNQAICEHGLHITVILGNEIYFRSHAPALLATGEISTLAASDYVLVEFNPMKNYKYIRSAMYQLLADGYRPILAHVERYIELMSRTELIKNLIDMGCYVQVNAGTICGDSGWKARQECTNLIKKGYVHFIATDAHDIEKRAPYLNKAAKIIERKFGKDMVRKLLITYPEKVIKNEYI